MIVTEVTVESRQLPTYSETVDMTVAVGDVTTGCSQEQTYPVCRVVVIAVLEIPGSNPVEERTAVVQVSEDFPVDPQTEGFPSDLQTEGFQAHPQAEMV